MSLSADFGHFLRARRAALAPEMVGGAGDMAGTPATGRRVRRVPGLRRAEVARLAGVSVEYYSRLEQGRCGRPSPEVLDSLARALMLSDAERAHLMALAGGPVPRHAGDYGVQRVRPGVRQLFDALDGVPAFVVGRRTDVLAANWLARALIADFDALPVRCRNFARFVFMDPAARERYADWADVAAQTTAILRREADLRPDDRGLAELIGELRASSGEFASWWGDHRIVVPTHGVKRLRHPLLGELTLNYEALLVPGDADQTLAVYTAETGSRSAEALLALSEPGWCR
jgi:transcriptional regulator with XRE-family HTH domain